MLNKVLIFYYRILYETFLILINLNYGIYLICLSVGEGVIMVMSSNQDLEGFFRQSL